MPTTRRSRRSLPVLARKVHASAQNLRKARQETDFHTQLSADSAAPALLLSPHCDDAVLDCWSLLESDRDLAVVNLFAGIPPRGQAGVWEALMGVSDSAERVRERMAEDARALDRAGRKPVNLSLLDAQFRGQAQAAPSMREIDDALAAAVRQASQVYAPAGIGSHRDHVLTRRYARMLLRAGLPVTLYAELPYCTFHGWPSWVDGSEPAPNRNVDAYWGLALEGVPEMPALQSAEIVRLDGPAALAKGEAVMCYEASLNYGVRHLMADPAFGGFEVRWALAPPGAPA
jgi:hypothetical protein